MFDVIVWYVGVALMLISVIVSSRFWVQLLFWSLGFVTANPIYWMSQKSHSAKASIE